MKILVVGANGQIGRHLVQSIQNSGEHVARAMVRKEEQVSHFKELGAETAVVDLEGEIEEIAKAADGVDAVVFTAGSGPKTGKDKTIMVDLDGAVKTIEATKKAGVKRFVIISSYDTTREAIQNAGESMAPYVVAKHYADEWLRGAGLDYTMIHPGLLTNDAGTGKVDVGPSVKADNVAREDIANVIFESLKNDATIGKEFKVINGQTPIQEALGNL
ncbi:Cytosine deaminase [Lentibacillus sp. JNUCC-1]|uniref:SDR family oxidoreductase n=1 Tax=Lentibacillus sp. JNUCC-1 TaxID=2654513 RepID=UPI0012E7D1C0|nr:SDR family oxidoreductase [Lentibacillus sp. JNUCC-1]MUV38248.1 Cytosine deaminase [Lentibacillus sp. JNUCC-1]